MNKDILELLKDIEVKRFIVAGYRDKHYLEIELNKEDLARFETQYLQFYINKVEELRKDKLELEEAVQRQINTIGELVVKDTEAKFKIANFDEVARLHDLLLIEKEKLEKALDKACVILSHEDIYPCDCGEDNKSLSQCYKCNDEFVNVKECWKEWCMKGD